MGRIFKPAATGLGRKVGQLVRRVEPTPGSFARLVLKRFCVRFIELVNAAETRQRYFAEHNLF